MKRLVWSLFFSAFAMGLQMGLQTRAQDYIYTVGVTFTNTPADGDTITVNGSARTFKTTVTSAGTQVARGSSALEAAQNYSAQLNSYRYTGISHHQNGATLTLIGTQNRAITASKTGTWGTVTVTSNVVNEFSLVLPLSAIPNTTGRVHIANLLVSDLSTIPSASIAANATSLSNFVNLSATQTISGVKILTNAASVIANAQLSSVTVTQSIGHFTTLYADNLHIYVPLVISNALPSLLFHTVGGSANAKRSYLTTYGDQTRYALLSDDGATENDVFIIGRSGASPTSFALYTKLVPSATGIGIEGGLQTNIITTNAIGGFSQVFVDGLLTVTANGGIIRMVDSGGSANDKTTELLADGDAFSIRFKNDAGSVIAAPLTISRMDGAASLISLAATLVEMPATAFGGAVSIDADCFVSTALVTGDNTPTLPAGFSAGLYMLDSSSPSADPATGTVLFSSGGKLMYRTSGSSEGAGSTFFLHNRASTTAAGGSDYTFTGSTAAIDTGTDAIFQAPTAGTYLIMATTTINGGSAGDDVRLKLTNTTAASDVSNSDVWVQITGQRMAVQLQGLATAAAGDNITIYGHNATSARGTVEAARTRITGVRLY